MHGGELAMSDLKNEKKHIFEQNKKYYTISIYTIFVILICAVLIKLIFSWGATTNLIGKYISALYPIIFGFLIAYMLNPLVNLFERKLFKRLFKIPNATVCKIFAIILSYIIFLGLIIIVVVFLSPQLYNSATDLVARAQEWYSDPTSATWVVNLQKRIPSVDVIGMMNNLKSTVMTYLDSDNLSKMVSEWVPTIFSTAGALFTILYNIVFSLIVSVYVIIDKRRIIHNIKRLIRAVFSRKKARFVNRILKQVHRIFSGFIIGKTIDSLIIGTLCFVLMSILRLPYPLLISLIVGITNMIPYIGPFVGAIPGFIIILMLDPWQSLIYLIVVLAVQWFDGFYLGPKILGVSTGLRPVWIIFALCIGGAAAGVMGMFLGVPFVASIALMIDQWLDYKNENKRIIPMEEDDASPAGNASPEAISKEEEGSPKNE